ncbi:MAG TPA: polyprenyl synthetase family protein [Planctomycetes bacterium]|nr:polyprenyl synthetase family protein [Planctomycetota bacterium]
MSTSRLDTLLAEGRAWADDALKCALPDQEAHPERLHRAMHYALFGGGKRLRPILVRLLCEGLGGSAEAAGPAAAAIEMVHTYSLVHDDLPCMDDDALRRGRPTVHVAFDEATAVLVGDALLTHAFTVLAGEEAGAQLVQVLSNAAGPAGMVGGQMIDLVLELEAGAGPAGRDAVEDLHDRKTAALFGAATEMGAIVAGADAGVRGRARAFGRALGLAFQAVDDVLDVTGDAGTLGKTPGKDASLERATLVAAVGLEGGRRRAERLTAEARDALDALSLADPGPLQELIAFVLHRSR